MDLTNLPIANYRQMSQFSIIHFFPKVIKVWNQPPYGVTPSSTLSCFKQSALPAIRSETYGGFTYAQVGTSYMIIIIINLNILR